MFLLPPTVSFCGRALRESRTCTRITRLDPTILNAGTRADASNEGTAEGVAMPIAYHPGEPLSSLHYRVITRTLSHPLYVGSIAGFVVLRVGVAWGMSPEGAKQLDLVLTYPVTLVGTLFAFLIGFFTNNCYVRFMDSWRAAMVGWSRLNDLALQIFAHVPDRTQACDVLRLMNAANHLCYGDLAGKNMLPVCVRRHLLTDEEARKLRKPGGAPPFYQTAAWALRKLADQGVPRPVDRMAVHRMDLSIIEWRQQTTLLPMIQMNPLPFPYYRNMTILLIIFEIVVAFKICLQGFESLGGWAKLQAMCIDFLLFAAITLLCQSLWITSISLLMPWRPDGKRAGSTINLPAEYFILLPLVGHRQLFHECGPEGEAPEAERTRSIFLNPFHREDTEQLTSFTATDSWKMMKILHASFRELAPGDGTLDGNVRPAGKGQFVSIDAGPEHATEYRLMRSTRAGSSSPTLLDD